MRSSPSCTIWPWRTGRPYQTGLNQATRRPSRVRRRSLVRPCTAARAGSVRPQAHKAPDGESPRVAEAAADQRKVGVKEPRADELAELTGCGDAAVRQDLDEADLGPQMQ